MSTHPYRKEPPQGFPGTEKRVKWNAAKRALAERKRIERGEVLIDCEECGTKCRSLAAHVLMRHKMSIRDYLFRHYVPIGFEISTKSIHQQAVAHFENHPEIQSAFEQNLASGGFLTPETIKNKTHRMIESYKLRPRSEAQIVNDKYLKNAPYYAKALEARKLENQKKGTIVNRICEFCGTEYLCKRTHKLHYCTRTCYEAAKKVGYSIRGTK